MNILMGGRQSGKTTQLVKMMREDPAGVLVCATMHQAKDVADRYGLDPKRVISSRTVMSLRGITPIPVLYIDGWDMIKSPSDFLGFPIAAVVIDQENVMGEVKDNPFVVQYDVPLHKRPHVPVDEAVSDLLARTNAPVELHNRFTYHRPQDDQGAKYETIRAKGLVLAELINRLCPESEELKTALDRIDEAVMWANAAIARAS